MKQVRFPATIKKHMVFLMKKLIKPHLLTIAGIIAGAITGYLYWKFVGCSSGSCAITSKPFNSSMYGAVMGGLLFSMIKKDKKEVL